MIICLCLTLASEAVGSTVRAALHPGALPNQGALSNVKSRKRLANTAPPASSCVVSSTLISIDD